MQQEVILFVKWRFMFQEMAGLIGWWDCGWLGADHDRVVRSRAADSKDASDFALLRTVLLRCVACPVVNDRTRVAHVSARTHAT